MNAKKGEIAEDYLRGRNNPLRDRPDAEVRGKLASVVEHFGKNWLEKDGNHPLQKLWRRQDGLATNELLILGDALQRLRVGNENWLWKAVNRVKTGDPNNRAGAIFELIGLSLLSAENQRIIGAPDNKPGYDGEVVFENGQTLRASLKSYGDSVHEREVVRQSRMTEDFFVSKTRELSLNGLGFRILGATFPSAVDWNDLRATLSNVLALAANTATLEQAFAIGNMWKGLTYRLPDNLSPLSAHYTSYVALIMVPLHKNEQKNLLDKIEDACTNFAAHPGDGSENRARAVFVRLPSSASVMKCTQTAREYFEDRPESPLDAVILYQPTVSRALKTNQSTINHHITFAGKSTFQAWCAKLGIPISIRVWIGAVSTEPTKKMLSDGTSTWPADDYYTYQKGNIYREFRLNAQGQTTGELGSPAAGVLTHAVMEALPGQFGVISGKLPPEEQLELFS